MSINRPAMGKREKKEMKNHQLIMDSSEASPLPMTWWRERFLPTVPMTSERKGFLPTVGMTGVALKKNLINFTKRNS